jgi:hypothetical protein
MVQGLHERTTTSMTGFLLRTDGFLSSIAKICCWIRRLISRRKLQLPGSQTDVGSHDLKSGGENSAAFLEFPFILFLLLSIYALDK